MQPLFNQNPGYPSEYLGIPPDTLDLRGGMRLWITSKTVAVHFQTAEETTSSMLHDIIFITL